MLNISVILDGYSISLKAEAGMNLLEFLRNENIYVPALCNGNGTCGKCLVKIISGSIAGKTQNNTIFACNAVLDSDCTISFAYKEAGFDVNAAFLGSEQEPCHSRSIGNTVIAVDIGTTTCVICAVDASTGGIIGAYTDINRQRVFGADVISRIGVSGKRLNDLTSLIRGQVFDGIKSLVSQYNIPPENIEKIAIAANTAMMGFFIGENCTSLGHTPFNVPDKLKSGLVLKFSDIFGNSLLNCPIVTLPCISAFIGADILAGALFCSICKLPGHIIIADLGTNGEIILKTADGKIFCTSAAAGPALEGGNISCGMGSASGAVCSVGYNSGNFKFETIGNYPPIGICGSGAIDLVAALVKNGIVDDTGLLCDEYFDSGIAVCENVVFTQGDVRQIQLAKSAIRSGLDCLIKEAGINFGDIDKFFLGGGFGNSSNIENMVQIGLLPIELLPKTAPCGNTALGGASKWLLSDDSKDEADYIIKNSIEVSLGDSKYFSERFMDNMMF